MKKISLIIISIILIVLLHNCSNESTAYDLDFIHKNGIIETKTNALYIRTDDNLLLYPKEGKTIPYSNGERITICYRILGTKNINNTIIQEVDVISISKYAILPLQIFTKNQEDILANDPIASIAYWTTSERFDRGKVEVKGDYLYMLYFYYVYDYRKHSVDIAYYEKNNLRKDADTIWLEIRHDAKNDAYIEKSGGTHFAVKISEFQLPEKRSRIIAIRHKAQENLASIPYNATHYIYYKW